MLIPEPDRLALLAKDPLLIGGYSLIDESNPHGQASIINWEFGLT